MRILLIFLLWVATQTAYAQVGRNTLRGTILFSSGNSSVFSKGTSYDRRKPAQSAEKVRLDAMNAPQKNVYISLHPLNFDPQLPVVNAQITQREKTFLPNIIAITAGSTVYFMNEDEHFHNIYSVTPRARFNIGRRPPGNVYAQQINKVGVVKLGCDIHAEMGAVILSLNTPYFTKVSENGSYEISGIPDGAYELRLFHPAFHRYATQIQFQGGSVKVHNATLNPKS